MKRELFGFTTTSWFASLDRVVSVLANVAVVVGIAFAFVEIRRSSQAEMRRTTIEAIGPTRSPEFLKSYARLKTAVQKQEVADNSSVVDDLNYVMNVYDNVAILVISDLVEPCIVKDAVYPALEDFRAILRGLSQPEGDRQNLDIASSMLAQHECRTEP